MRVMKASCFILLAAFSLIFVSSCGDDENAAVFNVYNYPNPFTYANGTTIVLKYNGGAAAGEKLIFHLYIYDLNGFPVVAQAITMDIGTTGEITIPWNAANEKGKKLAPGLYHLKVVTVRAGDNLESLTATHTMMVQ